MRIARTIVPATLVLLALTVAQAQQPTSFDQVIERVTANENQFLRTMEGFRPLVETYIQNMRPDPELGSVPANDEYFLGRLDLRNGLRQESFMGKPGWARRFLETLGTVYSVKYMPLGFMAMVMLDGSDFDRQHYDFKFVRREFLGDVRCLVIDATPKPGAGKGRFLGRIWVEDQDYNIVRFNGTYGSHPHAGYYLHFDSWRLNMKPGLWLPAYIYTEESDLKYRFGRQLQFKAQSRLWGYDLDRAGKHEEFSTILVDAPMAVKDQSEGGQDLSPVQSQRAWERQAEENVLERLEKAGLLAPEGEVDKVLQTVVNNLEVTNNLDIQPDVRCRVLLTAPLESFTIGHTIVVSRGLIDVLPDEATLAAVLAHELGHIALGHRLDTKFAFNDRMLFNDDQTFRQLSFRQDPRDEDAADQKAMGFLQNSPYKDKLGSAGLFMRALSTHSAELPNLIRAHMGNGMMRDDRAPRMSALMSSAPSLEVRRTDQIAALPLGGRIKLDPWADRVELTKNKAAALLSPREKMSFEVTPIFPYLTRAKLVPEKVAANSAK